MIREKRCILGFALLMYAFCAFGQPPTTGQDVLREVSYETSTSKCFKVPCDVEVEDLLAGIDWVYLQTKPALIRQTKFVIADYWLTIINTYPQQPRYERDYEYQMGKSVTDAWGTRLYYHNGEEYSNLENEEANEGFLLDEEAVETYGFYNGMFDVSVDEIEAFCDSAGVPYYRWGQKLLIVQEDDSENERTEIEADFEQLSFETRLFRDSTHVLTDRTEYLRTADGWIIPAKAKRIYYSELPSEIRYQITEIETYLSYRVVAEDGEVLVNMEKPFTIQVSPDPAQDSICVHFSSPIDETVEIKITDIANTTVWEQEVTLAGSDYTIDISLLESGMYTVFCTYNDKEAQADFLKEGVGQYTNPNLAILDIQIVPNPVLDNITVVFPVAVNAQMHVKIMDVVGMVHLQSDMYVAGNNLLIDVADLPTGIYYIVCVNDDGTAYAKFIKL